MKMLYVMAATDGAFNSNTATAPDAVCYPISRFKGLMSTDDNDFDLMFEALQSAGTDTTNNSVGTDKISFVINTSNNIKAAAKALVQAINKFVGKDNGFVVLADASDANLMPSSDFSTSITILVDEPA
tara:strand:- start:79 stop:462 length:384 start_codon:yes stop_codon:yes gene_type:complete